VTRSGEATYQCGRAQRNLGAGPSDHSRHVHPPPNLHTGYLVPRLSTMSAARSIGQSRLDLRPKIGERANSLCPVGLILAGSLREKSPDQTDRFEVARSRGMSGLPFPVRHGSSEGTTCYRVNVYASSLPLSEAVGLPAGSPMVRSVALGDGYQGWLPLLRGRSFVRWGRDAS
jgi:hypothetical protein